MKTAKELIQDPWLKISAKSINFQDQWLCDETVLRKVKARYTSLPDTITLNRKAVNTALSSLAGPFNQTNINGVYHAKFKTTCPYDDNVMRLVHYYYRHVHDTPPSQPTAASDVEDIIARSNQMHFDQERISKEEKEKNNNDEVGTKIKEAQDEKEKNEQLSNQKQQKKNEEGDASPCKNKGESASSNAGGGGGASTDGGNGGGGDGGPDGDPNNNKNSTDDIDNTKNIY